jgi:hypothetical protein
MSAFASSPVAPFRFPTSSLLDILNESRLLRLKGAHKVVGKGHIGGHMCAQVGDRGHIGGAKWGWSGRKKQCLSVGVPMGAPTVPLMKPTVPLKEPTVPLRGTPTIPY